MKKLVAARESIRVQHLTVCLWMTFKFTWIDFSYASASHSERQWRSHNRKQSLRIYTWIETCPDSLYGKMIAVPNFYCCSQQRSVCLFASATKCRAPLRWGGVRGHCWTSHAAGTCLSSIKFHAFLVIYARSPVTVRILFTTTVGAHRIWTAAVSVYSDDVDRDEKPLTRSLKKPEQNRP